MGTKNLNKNAIEEESKRQLQKRERREVRSQSYSSANCTSTLNPVLLKKECLLS